MAYSLQGLNNYVSSEISKIYWLNKIYPPEIRLAHTDGDFHIHDLGILSVYCVGWDLEDLLLQGFKGAPGKVESRPARHLRSALGQIVNFFYTLQGEAAGAQAFSHFDTLLAPFIRFDAPRLRGREAGAAGVRLQHQRAHPCGLPDAVHQHHHGPQGARACCRDKPVIFGGEYRDETYGEFQEEMDDLQPGLPGGSVGGGCQGPRVHLPHPDLQHHEGLRPGTTRPGRAVAGDGALRHPLLLQLRELRHVPRGHAVHVLPPAAGPARPASQKRWRSAAAALRRQPADRVHRRGDHQHAAAGLPVRGRGGVPPAARGADGAGQQSLEIKRKMLEQVHREQPLSVHEALPARHPRAIRPVLEEPFLHDRPCRAERGHA